MWKCEKKRKSVYWRLRHTNDILGPFYRPDAPTCFDMTEEGLSGYTMVLKGKVYKSDCITPLQNALVEIWHCNTKGEYDNNS